MSRRRRAGNPVSLFPFVAVMASTMGALILLLLVTAHKAAKARDAAYAAPIPEIQLPELPPLPGLVELPKLDPLPPHVLPPFTRPNLPELPALVDPRAAIEARRKAIERELAELRAKRERIPKTGEERLAPLMREAALLRERLQALIAERAESARQASELERKTARLAAEKQRVVNKMQRVENRYAIVPYVGPNGTQRRPIYLDCRRDRIILQPENVVVGMNALRHPGDAENPLAAMVHALADLLKEENVDGRPYPLLLVRPDGIETYYTARAALEFLRYSFGYELVPDDIELAFPAASEKVRILAQTTLQQAQQRQDQRFARRGRVGVGRRRSNAGGGGNEQKADGSFDGDGSGGLADGAGTSQRGGNGRSSGRSNGSGSGDSESGGDTGPAGADGAIDDPRLAAGGDGTAGGDHGELPTIGASVEDYVRMHDAGPSSRPRLGSLWRGHSSSSAGSAVASNAGGTGPTIGGGAAPNGSSGGGSAESGFSATGASANGSSGTGAAKDALTRGGTGTASGAQGLSVSDRQGSGAGAPGVLPEGLAMAADPLTSNSSLLGGTRYGPGNAGSRVFGGDQGNRGGYGSSGEDLDAGSEEFSAGTGSAVQSSAAGFRGAQRNASNASASGDLKGGAQSAAEGSPDGAVGGVAGFSGGDATLQRGRDAASSGATPPALAEALTRMANHREASGESSSHPPPPLPNAGPIGRQPTEGPPDELAQDARLGRLGKSVERAIVVECRDDALVLPNTNVRIALRGDRDIPAAVRKLIAYAFGEVVFWPPAPGRRQWRPTIVLHVYSGGLANAYRLRVGLLATGAGVRHELVDSQGRALLAPPKEG